MKFRKAKKEDLNGIARVFRDGVIQKPYSLKLTQKQSVLFITDLFKLGIIYVAEEKTIVGFVAAETYNGATGWKIFILELWVDSDQRGKGIGKILLNTIEKHFKKNKIKSIELLTREDCSAINFYKKHGFKETKYVKMEKKLS